MPGMVVIGVVAAPGEAVAAPSPGADPARLPVGVFGSRSWPCERRRFSHVGMPSWGLASSRSSLLVTTRRPQIYLDYPLGNPMSRKRSMDRRDAGRYAKRAFRTR